MTPQVSFHGQSLQFVHDYRKQAGQYPASALVATAHTLMEEVQAARIAYSQWEDNHDGFLALLFSCW